MSFETALLLLGGLLLGVGLLGRIEVKEAALGTESLAVRFTCGLLGFCLIGIAVQDRFPLDWLVVGPDGSEVVTEVDPEVEPVAGKGYFVVVSSTLSREEASRRAKRLEVKAFPARVYESTTGYLAVAVRFASRSEAEQARKELVAAGLAASDSYISRGKGLTVPVAVGQAVNRPHNQAPAPGGSAAGEAQ